VRDGSRRLRDAWKLASGPRRVVRGRARSWRLDRRRASLAATIGHDVRSARCGSTRHAEPAGAAPADARSPAPEPFDSPAHLFEPIWGGVRALAVIGSAEVAGAGAVTLIGEDGVAIAPTPVDLAGLASRVAARSAVLDGEIVVVNPDGRLDRPELDRRLAGEPGRPLAYLAFDILDLDGISQLRLPLERRREVLRRVLRPGDELVAVPAIADDGRALFEAVAAQGLAGVRARQAGSPYLPGVRSRLWRSIAVPQPGRSARRTGASAGATVEGAPLEPGDRGAPVLALIARLPLGLDDEVPPAP
jgi:ATP-dependent DNA ligase